MSESDKHSCCIFGCNAPVPAELAPERLCVPHFILHVDQVCAEMRRETAGSMASAERQAKVVDFLGESAMTLARVAIGSSHLSDEVKKRVLTTFLTLMNLRESLDRASTRQFPELRAAS